MIFFIPIILSILARQSGGGIGARHLDKINATWLPELIFAAVLAYFAPSLYWFIPALVWSYIWMQSGHGTFYNMLGYNSPNDPDRIQTIEKIVRPVYNLFSGNIGHPAYSWVCMGFKGAMIAVPLGFTAVAVNAILWPLAYYIGNRIAGRNEIAECLSGAFLGLIIIGLQI